MYTQCVCLGACRHIRLGQVTFFERTLLYIQQIKTPTMVMLGLDDRRVPPKQGYELYKALKARNKPVR